MIGEILCVGAVSFLGGVGRYLVSLAVKNANGGFPWSTWVVNVAGALLLGFLSGFFVRSSVPFHWFNLFFAVGVCGGFTTFSTFTKDALLLLQSGQYFAFVGYVLGSVVLGMIAIAVGWWLAKW